MSEENVEVVRQALNAWIEVDEGLADPDRVRQFFAPDVVVDWGSLHELVGGQETSETRGVDEFIEWRAAWMEPYDDFSYEARRILDAGANRVVATFHQRGKPRGSDSWVEMHYGIVYTFEEGLITRAKLYPVAAEALEAAGLSE